MLSHLIQVQTEDTAFESPLLRLHLLPLPLLLYPLHRPRLPPLYGMILWGSLGNKLANLTLPTPAQKLTMRSRPKPPPAWGGQP